MSLHPTMRFSLLGHFFFHVVFSTYFVVVLTLDTQWSEDYATLISAWAPGAMILGLAAPLAGFLSDRMGERIMMILYFFGVGGACILVCFSGNLSSLTISLGGLAFFGAIYHPVGIPWALRFAKAMGTSAGRIGVSGSLGVAASPLFASLIYYASGIWWGPFAFYSVIFIALGMMLASTSIPEPPSELGPSKPDHTEQREANPKSRTVTIFILISLAMFMVSLSYSAFSAYLPRHISLNSLQTQLDMSQTGFIVSVLFLFGAVGQLLGGALIDRFGALSVFMVSLAVKALFFATMSLFVGPVTLIAAWLIIVAFDMGSPSESVLISAHGPAKHRGLLFGIRNAVSLVAAPLGVYLVAWSQLRQNSEATILFLALAAGSLAVLLPLLLVFLRRSRSHIATT